MSPRRHRRDARAGRLVHERHELVGEPRHRAADADPADVRAPADTVDPSALGDVAFHDGPPASELHDALRRPVLGGEVALLVVAGAVAAFVHGRTEQPLRSQRVVERDHRRLAGCLVQQVQDRLREVVGVRRASRDAHDRDAGLRLPVPAEVVGNSHRAGRVAGHGVDAAVRCARARRENRKRLRRETIEPLARRHRLIGVGVVPEPAPVALALDRLVRDGAFHDEHERLELAAVGFEEPFDEVVGAADRAALEVDERPVHRDLRQPGQRTERDLLDARLRRGRERDGVAVAAQSGVDPEHVDDGFVRRGFRD